MWRLGNKGDHMKLARLNEKGIATFAGWLESVKSGGVVQKPEAILTSPDFTEPLSTEIEVESRLFESRYQAAEYFYGLFSTANLTDLDQDAGLWAWLSLFYFESVCPADRKGIRKIGATARYIPEPGDYKRYYRHLLGGPYRIYRAHRDDPTRAMAVLCQPLDKPGDVVEQLASRQEIITNRGVMELATAMYVEPRAKTIRRGAGGKSGGSARRLSDILEQFDLTWDIYAALGAELLAVMPKEFAKYKT